MNLDDAIAEARSQHTAASDGSDARSTSLDQIIADARAQHEPAADDAGGSNDREGNWNSALDQIIASARRDHAFGFAPGELAHAVPYAPGFDPAAAAYPSSTPPPSTVASPTPPGWQIPFAPFIAGGSGSLPSSPPPIGTVGVNPPDWHAPYALGQDPALAGQGLASSAVDQSYIDPGVPGSVPRHLVQAAVPAPPAVELDHVGAFWQKAQEDAIAIARQIDQEMPDAPVNQKRDEWVKRTVAAGINIGAVTGRGMPEGGGLPPDPGRLYEQLHPEGFMGGGGGLYAGTSQYSYPQWPRSQQPAPVDPAQVMADPGVQQYLASMPHQVTVPDDGVSRALGLRPGTYTVPGHPPGNAIPSVLQTDEDQFRAAHPGQAYRVIPWTSEQQQDLENEQAQRGAQSQEDQQEFQARKGMGTLAYFGRDLQGAGIAAEKSFTRVWTGLQDLAATAVDKAGLAGPLGWDTNAMHQQSRDVNAYWDAQSAAVPNHNAVLKAALPFAGGAARYYLAVQAGPAAPLVFAATGAGEQTRKAYDALQPQLDAGKISQAQADGIAGLEGAGTGVVDAATFYALPKLPGVDAARVGVPVVQQIAGDAWQLFSRGVPLSILGQYAQAGIGHLGHGEQMPAMGDVVKNAVTDGAAMALTHIVTAAVNAGATERQLAKSLGLEDSDGAATSMLFKARQAVEMVKQGHAMPQQAMAALSDALSPAELTRFQQLAQKYVAANPELAQTLNTRGAAAQAWDDYAASGQRADRQLPAQQPYPPREGATPFTQSNPAGLELPPSDVSPAGRAADAQRRFNNWLRTQGQNPDVPAAYQETRIAGAGTGVNSPDGQSPSGEPSALQPGVRASSSYFDAPAAAGSAAPLFGTGSVGAATTLDRAGLPDLSGRTGGVDRVAGGATPGGNGTAPATARGAGGPGSIEPARSGAMADREAGGAAGPAVAPFDGWKLHLATDQPQAVSSWLQREGYPHKVGRSGDQEGKDVTVYIGSRDEAEAAAQHIQEDLGPILKEPHGDTLADDQSFAPKVMGRFDIERTDPQFHQYGSRGVPYLQDDAHQLAFDPAALDHAGARQRADALLRSRYGTFYTGSQEPDAAPAAAAGDRGNIRVPAAQPPAVSPAPTAARRKAPPRPFTKPDLQKRIQAIYAQQGGGMPADVQQFADSLQNPFAFKSGGQYASEARQYVGGKEGGKAGVAIARSKAVTFTTDAAKAGGEDAIVAFRDRYGAKGEDHYWQLVRERAGMGFQNALDFARKSPDGEHQLLAAIYDHIGDGPRPKQDVIDPRALPVGSEFEILGHTVHILEDEDGYTVLRDGDTFPIVPVDQLTEVPIDKGTLRQAEPELPKGDVFGFDDAEPSAAKTMQPHLRDLADRLNAIDADRPSDISPAELERAQSRLRVDAVRHHLGIGEGEPLGQNVKDALAAHGFTGDAPLEQLRAARRAELAGETAPPLEHKPQFFSADQAGASKPGEGLYGQTVFDGATGNKQGSMFDLAKPAAPVSEPIAGSKSALDPRNTGELFPVQIKSKLEQRMLDAIKAGDVPAIQKYMRMPMGRQLFNAATGLNVPANAEPGERNAAVEQWAQRRQSAPAADPEELTQGRARAMTTTGGAPPPTGRGGASDRLPAPQTWPAAALPAPAVDASNVQAVYQAFRDQLVGKAIHTPIGFSFTPKPGHFFRLVAQTPGDAQKGFVAKASTPGQALGMAARGELAPADIAGYSKARAADILLLRDLLSHPQYIVQQRVEPANPPTTYKPAYTFLKRYEKKGKSVFLAVATDEGGNLLGLQSFGPRALTRSWMAQRRIVYTDPSLGQNAAAGLEARPPFDKGVRDVAGSGGSARAGLPESEREQSGNNIIDGGPTDVNQKSAGEDQDLGGKPRSMAISAGGAAVAPAGAGPATQSAPITPAHLKSALYGPGSFVAEDLLPRIKGVVGMVGGPADGIMRGVAPQLRGQIANDVSLAMREMMSRRAIKDDRVVYKLKRGSALFDGISRADSITFWDKAERGQDQGDPAINKIAESIIRLERELGGEARSVNPNVLQKLITNKNYLGRIFKRPDRAASIIAQVLARRPLEGRKGFTKRRSHDWFVDAINAGAEPVTYNPVDTAILKAAEMRKFIETHRLLNELSGKGQRKYVGVNDDAPEGWETLRDEPAFQVWGPPTVTVKEAFDKGVREGLENLIQKLGITHKRVVSGQGLPRKAWGVSYQNQDDLRTRFGGESQILAHEVGHALDDRYDLWNALTKSNNVLLDTAVRDQLKDLADLRIEHDPHAGETFRNYVREPEEQMAAVVQAYVAARNRMHEVAPDVLQRFEKLIDRHPELEDLRNIQPGLTIGTGEAEVPHGGLLLMGHYYVPAQAAQLFRNVLGKGLRDAPYAGGLVRGMFFANNILNQLSLGLSGFHMMGTAINAQVSDLALAISHAMSTRPQRALAPLLRSIIPGASVGRYLQQGNQMIREWLEPGSTGGDFARLVREAVRAGARVQLDKPLQLNGVPGLLKAIRQISAEQGMAKANPLLRALTRVPGALVQLQAWPVMQFWVPRLKMGAFAEMARRELQRLGSGATEDQLRKVMKEAWDSVDNRFGQLVYDNTFWHPIVKDILQLATRSPGWWFGDVREGTSGAIGLLQSAGEAARGKGFRMRPSSSFALALPLMAAAIGAALYAMFNHKRPRTLKDCYYPPTGELDQYGKPIRIQLPTYMKDTFSLSHDPKAAALAKLSPWLNTVMALVKNEDWRGQPVHKPGEVISGDTARFIAKQAEPFSIEQYGRMKEQKLGFAKRAAAFFGVTGAPSWVNDSPAEATMKRFLAQRYQGPPPTTQSSTKAQTRKDLASEIRTDHDKGMEDLNAALRSGAITTAQYKSVRGQGEFSWLASHVWDPHTTIAEAMKVFEVADGKERQDLYWLIRQKITDARKLTPLAKQTEIQRLDQLNGTTEKAAPAMDPKMWDVVGARQPRSRSGRAQRMEATP